MRTIFLGGIHGAGKTLLAAQLSQGLGIRNYSAGQLLLSLRPKGAEAGKAATDPSSLETDQLFVIRRLQELVKPLEYVLLDGHFAIAPDGAEIVAIPTKYFKLLEPAVLLLLDTPANEAHRRLLMRDGDAPTLEFLERLRSQELATARSVSESLSVPLLVLSGPDGYSEALTCVQHHQLGTLPSS